MNDPIPTPFTGVDDTGTTKTLLVFQDGRKGFCPRLPDHFMPKMVRRYLYFFGAEFLLFVFSSIMYNTRPYTSQLVINPQAMYLAAVETDRLSAVVGRPTAKFRDNLKPDQKYITSWLDAGWSNDVITYMNLIYLGLVTQRIPIIGYFIPSHLGYHVAPIDFSKVFDLPRLSKLINLPVIEWHEVKDRNSTEIDELGCWDIWSVSKPESGKPRNSRLLPMLNIDISYTRAPDWVNTIPNFVHDRHSSLFGLASLAEPEIRLESLMNPVVRESPHNHVRLPPDEHLVCYDYLYYVSTHFPFEHEYDYGPAWKFVGQHMHWTPELEELGSQYLRRTLNLERSDEPTPPYISIHVRHGDFDFLCRDLNRPIDECFSSLDVIERRVKEVQEELWRQKGMRVEHVVMTSDEVNSTWWEDVKQKGWYVLDHSRTAELYGPWYPILIDAVVQSNGVAFLGTDKSTMSVMARRRIQSWHDGVVRSIKWGKQNADDH